MGIKKHNWHVEKFWGILNKEFVDILHRIICEILGEGVQAAWTSTTIIEGIGIGDSGGNLLSLFSVC